MPTPFLKLNSGQMEGFLLVRCHNSPILLGGGGGGGGGEGGRGEGREGGREGREGRERSREFVKKQAKFLEREWNG